MDDLTRTLYVAWKKGDKEIYMTPQGFCAILDSPHTGNEKRSQEDHAECPSIT